MLVGKHHPIRKHINRLGTDSKYRRESETFVLVGQKVCLEWLDRYPKQVSGVITEDGFKGILPEILGSYPLYEFPKYDYKEICGLKTVPDWVLWVQKPLWELAELIKLSRVVIFEGIQNPENLGTCMRSAAAFEWELILFKNCVDPFHPRALRAMSGAIGLVPFWEFNTVDFSWDQFWILSLDPEASVSIQTVVQSTGQMDKVALVLGSEGQGCSDDWKRYPKYQSLKIDINPRLESLNVGVAAAVAMMQI